jgi:eukaryotic-like serine/threonine-protein kinase
MAQGTIAGRYQVVREVGRGGMGAVWLCEDQRLGRQVAVKQVGHVTGETAPDVARAMREARSSAPLNHPNVVAIYDAIEEGDHIWLVMEYVPGRTLSQIISEDGPVPPERVALIGAQVADGLAAAHERGTIHRDIKPSNILIGPEGRAKISDFGISRTAGEETLTQTGMLSGTPSYLSPEIARGEDPSPVSDVWALGATLYAAVEGHPPYASQPNPLATLQNIVNQPVPRPERAGVVTEPIVRMMDPDPQSRWAVADAAHALHRIYTQHRTDRTRAQTAEFGASGTATAATTQAHPAPSPDPTLEPTPTPTPTPEPHREPTPEPTPVPAAPPRRSRRGRAVLLVCGIIAVLVIVGALGTFLLNDDPTPTAEDTTEPSADTSASDSPGNDAGASDGGGNGAAGGSTNAPDTTSTGSPEQFVSDYYAVLPADTQTGWSMLTPGFQREVGSYGDYDGFWSTIDSVTVEDVQAAGPDAVDTTLVYTTDGSSQQEVRRIELTETDGSYLISGDDVVG